MKLTPEHHILIVGLGVIGGGYAKALSKQGFAVRCITLNEEDIAYALEKGMIAEGCTYTKNRVKHLAMIAGLGAICQAVSAFVMGGWYMNILITFSLSIATVYAIDTLLTKRPPLYQAFAILTLTAVAFFTFVLPHLYAEFIIDYKEFGVLLPVLLYYTKGRWQKLFVLAVMLLAMTAVSTRPTQWVCLFTVPLLALYNGKRGKANLKYLFYVFYPTHLVLLFVIDEFFCR